MDGPAFAARALTDATFLVERAAIALSRIGGAYGVCIVLLPADTPVYALACDGELQRLAPSVSSVLKSRFVDPERVPLSQRDRWLDPVGSGFVSRKAARRAAIAPFLAELGVRRQTRQHVCVGARLVGGFSHLRTTRADVDHARLDAFAATWAPLVRAHVSLASTHPHPAAARTTLTGRQQRIVALVADGLQNAEIAARLRLSPHTVKTVLHRLYAKTGTRGRLELVRRLRAAPSA